MSQQWGESFGGPPGVQVVRHGNGPLVRLKYDPSCTGRVMREGPSQSIVRWRNGNEDCVCNDWIERVEGITTPDTEPSKAQGAASKHSQERAVSGQPQNKPASKPRREPDALARRVSEFDDAELRAFALKNDVWQDKYTLLPNSGLRRMNVMNRLRAKIKREPEYEVKR